jgi:mono/diheme cytochrome c family protein
MSSTREHQVEDAGKHADAQTQNVGLSTEVASGGGEFVVPDPSQGPVPVWIVWLIGVAVFWAGAYLFSFSGGFRADVFDFRPKFGVAGGVAAAPDPKVVGKALFSANCITCHQADGQGVAGQYPPLAGSEVVLGDAANHTIAIVLKGLQGPVTIEGKSFNNSMQPWEGQYTDQQVAAILTYERSDWGNNAPPITADMVKEIRAEFKDRKDQWTWPEIQKIPAKNLTGGGGAAPGGKASPAPSGQPAAGPATQSQPPAPAASPGNAS